MKKVDPKSLKPLDKDKLKEVAKIKADVEMMKKIHEKQEK